MKNFKDERKFLKGAFPTSLQNARPTGSATPHSVEVSPDHQCYAVIVHDEVAKRFKLITRQGKVYSISYSLLPVFILMEGKELLIQTHDIQACIKGRNLGVLEEYLSQEKLTWIMQSPSGKDDGLAQVFVDELEVQMRDTDT